MRRRREERAIARKTRHKEKERQKHIEKANRSLISVSQSTRKSLGLISFDPSGTFLFERNRWMRVYRICEVLEEEKESYTETLKRLHSRIKITKEVAEGIFTPGEHNHFVTLTANGETYDEVRSVFMEDEETLNSQMKLKWLSIDDVFNTITRQPEKKEFSYASMIRGKKDWLKEFPKIAERSNHFLINGAYGEACFSLQFPVELLDDLSPKLSILGCPIATSFELKPIGEEGDIDFNRSLEKKYNRRITNGRTTNYFNGSYELLFICDSEDAREIVERTIISLYSKEGFIISPSIGVQGTAARGILSLGLMEHRNMRNVSEGVVDKVGR